MTVGDKLGYEAVRAGHSLGTKAVQRGRPDLALSAAWINGFMFGAYLAQMYPDLAAAARHEVEVEEAGDSRSPEQVERIFRSQVDRWIAR